MKGTRLHIYICVATLLAAITLQALGLKAQAATENDAEIAVINTDSLTQDVTDSVSMTKEHRGIWKKLVDYFRNSNKQKPNKKIDFGFIPGPNYSATTGLGLGLLGTATYSADRSDPTLPRSNASVYSNMTTGGFFMVGLRGNHIFPHERFQLDYKLNLSTFSTQYWGTVSYTHLTLPTILLV